MVNLVFCYSHTKLREADSLPRPVVLVEAEDAEELMGLVNKNEEAMVRIEVMMEPRWVSNRNDRKMLTNVCECVNKCPLLFSATL